MIILQELSQKLPNSAPESTFSFWFISQVVVTLIIFVGVYIILKPVFSKENDKQEKSKEQILLFYQFIPPSFQETSLLSYGSLRICFIFPRSRLFLVFPFFLLKQEHLKQFQLSTDLRCNIQRSIFLVLRYWESVLCYSCLCKEKTSDN